MSLRLRSLVDKGNIEKERLTLKAEADLDIGDYIVLQCAMVDGTLTTEVSQTIWFPYSSVSKGDLVIIYTKPGDNSSRTLDNGHKAHFFYWGLSDAIWASDQVAAVVLNAPTWDSKPATELSSRIRRAE